MKRTELKGHITFKTLALWMFCLGLFITGCGKVIATTKPYPSATTGPTGTPKATATDTSTPTPQQPLAVLLAGEGANQAEVSALQTGLNDLVASAGLRWQLRQQLSLTELNPGLRLVVVVPPDPGVAELVVAAPQTQFLAIGISGLNTSPNLTTIGAGGIRYDQQGFIAGVIAAMLSDDWRVGTISVADTVEGQAARTGFLNGVIYFCGLCRAAHPPFYEYPLTMELPSTATSAEWQEAANYMVDHAVQTVYIYPKAGDETMLSTLAEAKVNIISSGEPPQAARASWVVSLTSDELPLIQSQAAGLLDGSLSGGRSLEIPIEFTQINPALFTPGKQRLAQQILTDLQTGSIDTSVDLTTGENRP